MSKQIHEPEHHHEGHEHQRDEHCGCGHDHEHGHEHQHDEHCGCRHDHEHMHEHPAPKGAYDVYILNNLGCANCAAKMEDRIRKLPAVTYADITFATKKLRIQTSNSAGLLDSLQQICSSIEPDVLVIPEKQHTESQKVPARSSFLSRNQELLELCFGLLLFIGGEILTHLNFPQPLPLVCFAAAYLILGREILLTALKNLSRGHIFDENFLMSVATIGAIAIRNYAEAVGVMLFYRIGEYFEDRAVEKSRSQIMDALDLRPETVQLYSESKAVEIPAEEARPGDQILIRPGDRIPLDGKILEGKSQLDTSAITGEPVPVTVKEGDHISSGCVNQQGQLILLVEKPLSESLVSRILDAVENAAASKPKLDRFISRFARIYTPIVLLLALGTAIIPSIITGDWKHWIYTALTFLVISCPCALVLSVPLAFFSGIGAGSRQGILFKGGSSIEALKNIDTVVMDKTGTITQGNFTVQDIHPASDRTQDSLLQIAASCEQASTHPIALSLMNAAENKSIRLLKPEAVEELAGHGIHARIQDQDILCGNRKLMEKYHILLADYTPADSGSEVLIAVNGSYCGSILIADQLKSDAAETITRLHQLGLSTVMLTGDTTENAAAIAKASGIENFFARLLPQEKLHELQKLQKSGKSVMFVGDGINDAPVLAGADVGAAMGSGADAAIEAADVVFMNSRTSSIPASIRIARITGKIAVQNVIFALGVKAAVMILGLMGFASMWMAVFADSGVAMLCVLNSIRILYRKK